MAAARQSSLLNDAQGIIGYTFNNHTILWEALQAPGAPVFASEGRDFTNGNKRLALLGDALLRTVLLEGWYSTSDRIRKLLSGSIRPGGEFVSNALSENGNSRVEMVGNNANLAQKGRALGLQDCIHNNPAAGGMVSNGTMAQTVEAILGAVWLDSGASGLTAVRAVMATLGLD